MKAGEVEACLVEKRRRNRAYPGCRCSSVNGLEQYVLERSSRPGGSKIAQFGYIGANCELVIAVNVVDARVVLVALSAVWKCHARECHVRYSVESLSRTDLLTLRSVYRANVVAQTCRTVDGRPVRRCTWRQPLSDDTWRNTSYTEELCRQTIGPYVLHVLSEFRSLNKQVLKGCATSAKTLIGNEEEQPILATEIAGATLAKSWQIDWATQAPGKLSFPDVHLFRTAAGGERFTLADEIGGRNRVWTTILIKCVQLRRTVIENCATVKIVGSILRNDLHLSACVAPILRTVAA